MLYVNEGGCVIPLHDNSNYIVVNGSSALYLCSHDNNEKIPHEFLEHSN